MELYIYLSRRYASKADVPIAAMLLTGLMNVKPKFVTLKKNKFSRIRGKGYLETNETAFSYHSHLDN